MIFSSLLFLFWFIPVFFAVYYICPKRLKNAVLFLGSIVFYAWGEPKFLILIFISIFVNYLMGLLMDRAKGRGLRRVCLVLALVYDFLMLFIFKYTDFFIENINTLTGAGIQKVNLTLPLGISFYTFQIASYIIDLYRGKIKAEKSPLSLGTYLVMFPQLIAGPIVVYSQIEEQLHDRRISPDDVEEGIRTFILGLGSKVLIANNVGALFSDAQGMGFENISMPLAWLAMLSFSLQIYFDFNGYSLMAIGLGKMLGFDIPKNFNYPYISRSVTEFWRRWHITLSSWFKDYLYIPLGGSRKGQKRTYVNLLIVWLLTGFWHGAGWNFILWGLFFFVFLVIEKAGFGNFLERHPKFARLYSLLLIGFSWMIFAITDIGEMGVFFTRLFCFKFDATAGYYFKNYILVLIIGCILSTPVLEKFWEKHKGRLAGIIICTLILILSVAYLTDAAYNPFLYFRF